MEYSTEDIEFLERIQKKAGVSNERFGKGIAFAKLIAQGVIRTKAYVEAFNSTPEEARSNASNVARAKWIQELVEFFKLDEQIVLLPLRRQALKRIKEILDSEDDPTIVLKAVAELNKYETMAKKAKEKEKENTEEIKIEDEATIAFNRMMKKIQEQAKNGNAIKEDGTLIDVKVIK